MSGAKPLTKREWDDWAEYIARADSRLPDLPARITATIEHGWAPDEPSSYELNVWAAKRVMGWRHSIAYRDGGRWMDWGEDVTCIHTEDWMPAERVDQALQVAMETDLDVDVDLSTHDECGRDVKTAFVTVGAFLVHEGAFEPDVIARKIMLALHERLEAQQ